MYKQPSIMAIVHSYLKQSLLYVHERLFIMVFVHSYLKQSLLYVHEWLYHAVCWLKHHHKTQLEISDQKSANVTNQQKLQFLFRLFQ